MMDSQGNLLLVGMLFAELLVLLQEVVEETRRIIVHHQGIILQMNGLREFRLVL